MTDTRLCSITSALYDINSKIYDDDNTVSELIRLYHDVLFMHNTSIYLMYSLSGSDYDTAKCLYDITSVYLLKILESLKLKERQAKWKKQHSQ